MANITVEASSNIKNGNRVVVRTSGDRVYVFATSGTSVEAHKGNVTGKPASFDTPVAITSITGLQDVGVAAAIDSADLVHILYYQIDTSHGGIVELRYVTYNTGSDTFGTPEQAGGQVLDDDGTFTKVLAICVDANDDPHICWEDATTSMGDTTTTNYYSNKISGWRSRVTLDAKVDNDVFQVGDIMVADPLSSVNADRPIIVARDGLAISAFYGGALDASSFTEQTQVEGAGAGDSILGGENTPTVAIDSNEKIVIAFVNVDHDLSIVEHINSNTWANWEGRIAVDITSDYSRSSITIEGTNMYVYATDTVFAIYYYDGHNSITDNNAQWTSDSNAFDGNEAFAANTTSVGATNWLEGDGSTAPASGDTIINVETRVLQKFGSPDASSGNELNWQVLDAGTGLGTFSFSTIGSTKAFTIWHDLAVPAGGWTWAKVQDSETRAWGVRHTSSVAIFVTEIRVRTDPADIRLWKNQGSGWSEDTSDADLPNDGIFGDVKVKYASKNNNTPTELDYVFEDSSGNVLYNSAIPEVGGARKLFQGYYNASGMI